MITQNSLNNGARWEVRWRGKNGNIVAKPFDDDFGKAIETYAKLQAAGKQLVTLRSCNVGFAPPDRITHHERTTYKAVMRGGKKYKKKVTEIIDLMPALNRKGVWWCPYCIQLRRFDQDRAYRAEVVMKCPVCEITNYNWHVKRWNPVAKTIEFRATRRKRGTKRQRSR